MEQMGLVEPTREMGPAELLVLARSVAGDAPRAVGANRTIAAALLIRQALEAALDDWWRQVLPAMAETRDRAQQITLPFYLLDPRLAGDVTWAWSRLSGICHHLAYNLPPTIPEIDSLIDVVARLLAHDTATTSPTPEQVHRDD